MLPYASEVDRYFAAQQSYGHAACCLAKYAAEAQAVYSLSGELYVSKSGWVLLSVPNGFARGAFDALDELGVELPPGHAGSPFNAHISVMRGEELERIGGPSRITERGKRFKYNVGALYAVEPAGWDEMSKVYFLRVRSPELEALRKSYGLPGLPHRNGVELPFHITIGVRRKHVLRANEASKAAYDDGDQIPGGLADDMPNDEFAPKALLQGRKVEKEHTSSPSIATEIAKDHLTEDKRYYEKLKKIEGKTKHAACKDPDNERRLKETREYVMDLLGFNKKRNRSDSAEMREQADGKDQLAHEDDGDKRASFVGQGLAEQVNFGQLYDSSSSLADNLLRNLKEIRNRGRRLHQEAEKSHQMIGQLTEGSNYAANRALNYLQGQRAVPTSFSDQLLLGVE